MEYRILKNIPDLHRREKKLYISSAVPPKERLRPETGGPIADGAGLAPEKGQFSDSTNT